MDLLSLDQFAGCLHETFSADLQGMQIAFVLVEALPLPNAGPDGQRAPFSLVFHNDSALLFPQQTYRMQHPRLGGVDIFLVPVAQDKSGFLYQAVFNSRAPVPSPSAGRARTGPRPPRSRGARRDGGHAGSAAAHAA